MHPIDYFKSQAKKLLKDQKGLAINTETGEVEYPPCQFFNLPLIFEDFRLNPKRKPSLMQSQHVIALISGFKNWDELIHTPYIELQFRAKVFANQNKIHPLAWKESLFMHEIVSLDDEMKKYDEYLENGNFPWEMQGYLLISEKEQDKMLQKQLLLLEESKKMYPDGWHEKGNVRFEVKNGLIGRGIEISSGKNMTPLQFSYYDIDYVEGEVTAKEFWEDDSYQFVINFSEKAQSDK